MTSEDQPRESEVVKPRFVVTTLVPGLSCPEKISCLGCSTCGDHTVRLECVRIISPHCDVTVEAGGLSESDQASAENIESSVAMRFSCSNGHIFTYVFQPQSSGLVFVRQLNETRPTGESPLSHL